MNAANTSTQQRAHFMKQVGAKQQQMARSTVTMPVSEEMLLVKRQMVNPGQQNQSTSQVQHQQSPQQSQSPQQQTKTQILQQTFTPSIQLQSAGGSQQHIALVKTSTGTMVHSNS